MEHQQKMERLVSIYCALLALCSHVAYSSRHMVYGVAFEKLSFYNPAKDFTCLDGSRTIRFLSVNDDYCDCADGSDEPGTSACSQGRFYCENKGHKAQDIPSSRVNDGLCDCCDGTDEYRSSASCQNNCNVLGQVHQQDKLKQMEIESQGYMHKLEYMRKGKDAKVEQQQKLETLSSDLETKRARLLQVKEMKEELERPEKDAKDRHQAEWDRIKSEKEMHSAFNNLDTDKDGRLSESELMQNNFLATDLDAAEVQALLGTTDEEKTFGSTWETLKPKYLAEGRPNVEPPPVTPEQPVDAGTGDFKHEEVKEQPEIYETDEKYVPPEEPPINDSHDGEADEDEDEDEEEDDGGEFDKEEKDEADEKDEEKDSVKPDDVAAPDYDEETKALIEAAEQVRLTFREIEKEVGDAEREQTKINDLLSKDFGPQEEFSELNGQCYEYTDREYTYKFCPFDRVTQRSKDGGSDTDLGKYSGWAGEGDKKYSLMKNDGGTGCWNGPARSALVTFECGKENELLKVEEPSRCEYTMMFRTPASCQEYQHPTHDEF